jgi:hypothetical protein
LGRRGSRKEISKEKPSEKESLVQVELETKEQGEGITSEKTAIPTMNVMSMIGKKPGRKTKRKAKRHLFLVPRDFFKPP